MRFFSPKRLAIFGLILISIAVCHNTIFAQKKNTTPCIVVSNNLNAENKNTSGIQIENKTKEVIRCLFEFESNGFYDEASLRTLIMRGVDTTKSKNYNQLLILENIARIIKSPNHRNFHLIFSAGSASISNKKYSPLAMITSFYDKQCNDYQRLAAQMAILTPYFQWQDFKTYNIFMHNVLDVIIGNDTIFHDFDPGQPGFRFYKNDEKNKFASLNDLLKNQNLIKKEQFYKYNNVSLCPWISENYYRSLFTKINWQGEYSDLKDVFGFMPRWVIPPGAVISSLFPDTFKTGKFGIKILLDRKDPLVKKTFSSYANYTAHNNAKDSLKTNRYITRYIKKNFDFDFDIDYFYLISMGCIEANDSNNIFVLFKDNYFHLFINSGDDTLKFLDDILIPLPLSKVKVKQGEVFIVETEFTDNGRQDFNHRITDSLVLNLFDYSPPVFTSTKERKSPSPEATSLIYGPSNGYILPHSIVEFEYYYNPFYYSFHNLVFKIRYDGGCENKLDVSLKKDK